MIYSATPPVYRATTLPGSSLRARRLLSSWLAAICFAGLLASMGQAERVVVLHNGNTFAGDVTQQEHHVIVKRQDRKMTFATRDVDLVVPSLDEAYRRKAQRISRSNTHAREKLMAWCIQQHMVAEASEQLATLGKQHPSFPRLKLWRQRIESHGKLAGKTVLPTAAPLHPDVQLARESQPRLSKHTQSQFVREIQPILLNGCATAKCHGRATKSGYVLLPGRAPLARSVTQRNLGATLRQIGDASPDQSLLWMSAMELHGGAKKEPLSRKELEKLLGWILIAQRETHGNAIRVARGPQPELNDETNIDPFDPAEFNSQSP